MYFAAQFRRATGLRPHEYLLRRRIERGQEMLVGTNLSVADIAMSVGFKTQSHFTTVFKRFTDHSPFAWQLAASTRHRRMGGGEDARMTTARSIQRVDPEPETSSPSCNYNIDRAKPNE
jgi:AraC-like DNA-binding protein